MSIPAICQPEVTAIDAGASLRDFGVIAVMGKSEASNAVAEVTRLIGHPPLMNAAFKSRKVADGGCAGRLQAFDKAVQQARDSSLVVRPLTCSPQVTRVDSARRGAAESLCHISCRQAVSTKGHEMKRFALVVVSFLAVFATVSCDKLKPPAPPLPVPKREPAPPVPKVTAPKDQSTGASAVR